jgi:serine/threonine protein kinase
MISNISLDNKYNNIDSNTITNTNSNNYIENNQILNKLKRKISKIKLEYLSSGSNGVILCEEENKDYIFKITMLYDENNFDGINFTDSIFLNYFKINYPLESKKNYFPIQNISTKIFTFNDFLNYYLVDEQTLNKFKFIGIYKDTDYILINKMLNYDKNLHQYIKTKLFDISEDFDPIVKQLLKGIGLFHQDNLVHGDLKTSNIMFDGLYCKLIDFGGIKQSNSNYYSKTCTISTRPPEDIDFEYENENENNKKYTSNGQIGEMWSLGIILFELFIKKNPIDSLYSRFNNSIYESDSELKEKKIEKFINNTLKKYSQIPINDYLNIYGIKLNPHIIKKIEPIQKLLYVNPIERNIDIKTLYKEIFHEDINLSIKEKPRIINLSNISIKDSFNKYRKIIYPNIVKLLTTNKLFYSLELILNILDRYLCLKLNKLDTELIDMVTNPDDFQSYNYLLISSAVIIGVSIIYRKCINLHRYLNSLNSFKFISVIFTKNDITTIIKNISNILNTLSFDIINVQIDFSTSPEEIDMQIKKIIDNEY